MFAKINNAGTECDIVNFPNVLKTGFNFDKSKFLSGVYHYERVFILDVPLNPL